MFYTADVFYFFLLFCLFLVVIFSHCFLFFLVTVDTVTVCSSCLSMSIVLLVFRCCIMCFIAQKSCILSALVVIYLDVTMPAELINRYSLFCICVDTYSS